MTNKCLVIFRESPYSGQRAREGLEAVMAMAAYDQQPQLVFMAEGVWQLMAQQDEPERKNHSKMLAALSLYGVDQLFVHTPSLKARGLRASALLLPCEPLDDTTLAALIAQSHKVLSF